MLSKKHIGESPVHRVLAVLVTVAPVCACHCPIAKRLSAAGRFNVAEWRDSEGSKCPRAGGRMSQALRGGIAAVSLALGPAVMP